MIDLPRLSSSELVAQFGADEAALRRYRMLVALVREGRAPGEVARTYGVSRESLRRLRLAFAAQGMEALRQRKGGGGHIARGSSLATLIRQELDASPGIAAAALWRQVQAKLREQGAQTPRSTFYRLLAQLRAEGDSPPSAQAVGLLREALGALAEDPPLALGRSTLATLVLPEMRDPAQRGRALQQALQTAIKRLRPAEVGAVLDDTRWRHYLIIAGEYEVGEKRAALQSALALSASTYSRAKREAIERLFTLLPKALAELPPPAPPATLIAPPAPPPLYDDEATLDRYAARLRREGLLIIWGEEQPARHALAATLAARLRARGQKIAWHTSPPASEEDAGPPLLRALAAALALDGQAELWNALHAAEPAPFAALLELLVSSLAGRRLTIVLEQAQHLHDDAAALLAALLASQTRRDLRLVLVQDVLPTWAAPADWPALSALGGEALVTPDLALHTLRERVAGLLAAAPLDTMHTLCPEQLALVRAALQPLVELLGSLAPSADPERAS